MKLLFVSSPSSSAHRTLCHRATLSLSTMVEEHIQMYYASSWCILGTDALAASSAWCCGMQTLAKALHWSYPPPLCPSENKLLLKDSACCPTGMPFTLWVLQLCRSPGVFGWLEEKGMLPRSCVAPSHNTMLSSFPGWVLAVLPWESLAGERVLISWLCIWRCAGAVWTPCKAMGDKAAKRTLNLKQSVFSSCSRTAFSMVRAILHPLQPLQVPCLTPEPAASV